MDQMNVSLYYMIDIVNLLLLDSYTGIVALVFYGFSDFFFTVSCLKSFGICKAVYTSMQHYV